jgi:putative exosortase-associated protein (TIGR04073 family)
MKKLFKSLPLLFALCVLFPQSAMAEESYTQRMGQKLAVGFANIVTGFVELPKTIIVTGKENGPAYGATAGFATGLIHMVGRTLFGVADFITFPIPTKPMIYPDYIWNDFDRETTYSFYPRKN